MSTETITYCDICNDKINALYCDRYFVTFIDVYGEAKKDICKKCWKKMVKWIQQEVKVK